MRLPDAAASLDASEHETRVQAQRNFCVLDGSRFFVRVLLPLPALEAVRQRSYNIGLWAEVDRAAFDRIFELWEAPDRALEPPFAAVLANEVPYSDGSLGLAADLQLMSGDSRPCLYLKPSSNDLYALQAHGVCEHRIHEYTSLFS